MTGAWPPGSGASVELVYMGDLTDRPDAEKRLAALLEQGHAVVAHSGSCTDRGPYRALWTLARAQCGAGARPAGVELNDTARGLLHVAVMECAAAAASYRDGASAPHLGDEAHREQRRQRMLDHRQAGRQLAGLCGCEYFCRHLFPLEASK